MPIVATYPDHADAPKHGADGLLHVQVRGMLRRNE